MPPSVRRLLIAASFSAPIALCFVEDALADPVPAYAELMRQSLGSAPRLEEVRAGISQAEGMREQAGARPNPSFSAEVENFAPIGPSGDRPAADTRQNTFSIIQPIEFWGKRGARIEAGEAGVVTAQARMVQTQADYAFDLAVAYIEAEAAEQRLKVAQETLKLADSDARTTAILVKAGKEARVRQIQADTQRATALTALDFAQSQTEQAFARLTALTGASKPYTSISSSLLASAGNEQPETPDPLQTPAYKVALAARDEAQRKFFVEKSRAYPDVNASFGVRTFAGTDAKAFVGGVSVPLPVFDTNRGNISAAEAELRAANARLAIVRNDAEADGRTASARVRAALTRIGSALEAEKGAEQVYRLTRVGYEGGKLSFIEVLSSARALAEARTATIDARVERLTAEAAIARLMGAIPFGDRI